jgi:streptogramin lyase
MGLVAALATGGASAARAARLPTAKVTLYRLPPGVGGTSFAVVAADGDLWLGTTVQSYDGADLESTGVVSSITARGRLLGTVSWQGSVGTLSAGGHGQLWFVDPGGPAVGAVNPYTPAIGTVTPCAPAPCTPAVQVLHLTFHQPLNFPIAAAVTADGTAYFTQTGTPVPETIEEVARDGTVTALGARLPSSSVPEDLALGPGGTVWFTDVGTHAIGVIRSNGAVTEYHDGLGPHSDLSGLVAGPAGSMWFADNGPSGGKIGQITPSGKVTEVRVTPHRSSVVGGLAPVAGGGAFFTDNPGRKGDAPNSCTADGRPFVGYLTATGRVTRLATPLRRGRPICWSTGVSSLGQMTAGPGRNAWFAAINAGTPTLGRITPTG